MIFFLERECVRFAVRYRHTHPIIIFCLERFLFLSCHRRFYPLSNDQNTFDTKARDRFGTNIHSKFLWTVGILPPVKRPCDSSDTRQKVTTSKRGPAGIESGRLSLSLSLHITFNRIDFGNRPFHSQFVCRSYLLSV